LSAEPSVGKQAELTRRAAEWLQLPNIGIGAI